MIVLDASAAFEMVSLTPLGREIETRLLDETPPHAPHLLDLEVASSLRRHCALGALSPARARQALLDLSEMPLIRHPHYPLLPRIWEFRQNFTMYDASYLALAEALDATLLTRDGALASAPLHRGKIEVV
ncbi:MAG TPA: type II toxin-antitoxin system VapC family toxin [Bryobacteraceae bacterium]|nr:type II toxin-antitoxin system VapC family toxin [Bryobacteraceae bacterium]